jgi:aconitate hydratase
VIERDGFIDIFDKMGATVFANAWDHVLVCGIEGAERRDEIQSFSFNRNFSKRADGNQIQWHS